MKFRLGNIYKKIGVINRAQGIATAVRYNFIKPLNAAPEPVGPGGAWFQPLNGVVWSPGGCLI